MAYLIIYVIARNRSDEAILCSENEIASLTLAMTQTLMRIRAILIAIGLCDEAVVKLSRDVIADVNRNFLE